MTGEGGWEKEGGGRIGGGREGRRREAVNYTLRACQIRTVFLNSVLKHGAWHAPDRAYFSLTRGSICKHSSVIPRCDIADEATRSVLVDIHLAGERVKGAIKDVLLLP